MASTSGQTQRGGRYDRPNAGKERLQVNGQGGTNPRATVTANSSKVALEEKRDAFNTSVSPPDLIHANLPTSKSADARGSSTYGGLSSMERLLHSFQVGKARSKRILANTATTVGTSGLEAVPTNVDRSPLRVNDGQSEYMRTADEVMDAIEDEILDWDKGLDLHDLNDEDEITSFTSQSGRRTHIGPEGVTKLVPLSDVAHTFRKVFSFEHFNAMQSRVFDEIYNTDENIVVTAPTGSGKTVIFELAVVRMLQKCHLGKAVYLAPLKALCAERVRDWTTRFAGVGCYVLEMTGDTDNATVEQVRQARLIVATPEKWDIVTRRASHDDPLLSNLNVFMIDEVHSVREKVRGARLEVIIARTKARQSHARIVAVSATIPNATDIARWIGHRTDSPNGTLGDLEPFVFSELFRPCPLEKFVYGYKYSSPAEQYYRFDKYLDSRIMELLEKHSNHKPALIFCNSRKGAMSLAQTLALEIEQRKERNLVVNVPMPLEARDLACRNRLLKELSASGVGFHHAGLETGDKRAVEEAFMRGDLTILCATTSLSVGVNLPAYLVIVKGTKTFMPATMGWENLSDLTVLQMMGRAGRPQFDTSGVCIIMTEDRERHEWEALVTGRTTIESTLHHDLTEHVNAELAVQGECTAQRLEDWLKGTFLFVRLQHNPRYYELEHCKASTSPGEAVALTVRRILAIMSEHDLVRGYDIQRSHAILCASPYGEIMANYCLRFDTMIVLLQQENSPNIANLISALSHADEFKGFFLRQGEKTIYDGVLRRIRYPPVLVNSVADKVSVLLQANLAGIDIAEAFQEIDGGRTPLSIRNETAQIFQMGPKIAKAAFSIALERQDAHAAEAAFTLCRALASGSWDDSASALCQIAGIGSVFGLELYSAGYKSVYDVASSNVARLQAVLNRREPYVVGILKDAKKVPRLDVHVAQGSRYPIGERGFVECEVLIYVKLKHPPAELRNLRLDTADRRQLLVGVLVYTTNTTLPCCIYKKVSVERLRGGVDALKQRCRVKVPTDTIYVIAAVEEIAGSEVRRELHVRQAGNRNEMLPTGWRHFNEVVPGSQRAAVPDLATPTQDMPPVSPPSIIVTPSSVEPAASSGKKKRGRWPGAAKQAPSGCSHSCAPGCLRPCCPQHYVEPMPRHRRSQVSRQERLRNEETVERRIAGALCDARKERSGQSATNGPEAQAGQDRSESNESSEDIPLITQVRDGRTLAAARQLAMQDDTNAVEPGREIVQRSPRDSMRSLSSPIGRCDPEVNQTGEEMKNGSGHIEPTSATSIEPSNVTRDGDVAIQELGSTVADGNIPLLDDQASLSSAPLAQEIHRHTDLYGGTTMDREFEYELDFANWFPDTIPSVFTTDPFAL